MRVGFAVSREAGRDIHRDFHVGRRGDFIGSAARQVDGVRSAVEGVQTPPDFRKFKTAALYGAPAAEQDEGDFGIARRARVSPAARDFQNRERREFHIVLPALEDGVVPVFGREVHEEFVA